MFVGHFGLGFAGKRVAPAFSLGAFFLAAQFLDLLWPTFLLLGWEEVRIEPGNTVVTPLDFVSYPWSHSLLMAIVWGLVVGGVAYALRRDRRGALLLGVLVVSHWWLDWLTHRPDLPLLPTGGPKVGLGLWNSLAGTLVVELPLFALGIALYVRATAPRDGIGRWGLAGLIAFLALVHAASFFGPPPPSVTAIAWAGQAMWLLVALGFWVDRHREPRVSALAGG